MKVMLAYARKETKLLMLAKKTIYLMHYTGTNNHGLTQFDDVDYKFLGFDK